MFDGTVVRARHILLTPPANDPRAIEQAKVELLGMKGANQPPGRGRTRQAAASTDNLTREAERQRLLDEAFSHEPRKSACPSRERGGDVSWFPCAAAAWSKRSPGQRSP